MRGPQTRRTVSGQAGPRRWADPSGPHHPPRHEQHTRPRRSLRPTSVCQWPWHGAGGRPPGGQTDSPPRAGQAAPAEHEADSGSDRRAARARRGGRRACMAGLQGKRERGEGGGEMGGGAREQKYLDKPPSPAPLSSPSSSPTLVLTKLLCNHHYMCCQGNNSALNQQYD